MREHAPASATEAILVEDLAEHHWRILRYRRIEEHILAADELTIPRITAAQRFVANAERSFHRTLKALRELQKARGFVPQQTVVSAASKTDDQAAMSQRAAAGQVRAVSFGFVPVKSPQQQSAPTANSVSNQHLHPEKHQEEAA